MARKHVVLSHEQINPGMVTLSPVGGRCPNGDIPSGLTVAKVGGVLVPYTAAEGPPTGAGILARHAFRRGV